ncbi:hypothetical protein HDU76_006569 [Blyttiomyces sp. JEL0837]|nr:hypothetical protein HDU76_006569 [Blyttiomyces sp. JEL0837]
MTSPYTWVARSVSWPIISVARSRPQLHALPSLQFTHRNIATLKQHADSVEISFDGSSEVTGKYHYTWLRDNCQCPSCVHPDNHQKLHSSAHVDLNVKPTSIKITPSSANGSSSKATLQIEWPKHSLRRGSDAPHTSQFDMDWLQSVGHPRKTSLTAFRFQPRELYWDKEMYTKQSSRVDYKDYMNTDEGLLRALQQLQDFGLCFLKGVSTDDHREVEKVARRFGCIRETFYGTSWDVKSVPKATNIAYTALDLGLHMDLMYFEAPPGIQMLHSLKNSVTGGESTFLDSFKAVNILKERDPSSYKILSTVPVTFHYRNDGHIMKYRRKTIVDDDPNEPLKVYYAPPFQGPMEVAEDQVQPFYQAFQKFADILDDPSLVYRTLMKPGDLVLFHNRRVLHGRDEFDPNSGERHFKGTYVDLDDFKDKLATLSQAAGLRHV